MLATSAGPSLEAAKAAAEEVATVSVAAARAEVAFQREEEQSAVLAALGLAEERAVQMAAECEALREEKAALAAVRRCRLNTSC